MDILITGGAGFIGSHLADRLVELGHHVRILDNLSTGRIDNLSGSARAAEFLPGDIRDRALVRRAAEGISVIVHLAAVASVQRSMEDPLGTHATNLGGTLHCLEAAREAQVPRFLYASSAAIYGDCAAPPVDESASPAPLSPYAIDKLAGEHYLAHYHRQYGLNTTAFRFFNVYGPRQDANSPYSGVISRFVACARTGLPPTVYGDGRQTRDFVYVQDLVDVLVTSIDQEDLAGQALNVGTGVESDLLTLWTTVRTTLDAPAMPRFASARSGDIRRSCARIERLRQGLGFVPRTPLAEGLRALAAIDSGPPRGALVAN
ncbi:MAG: NAD-dependent epimerase/dehydratase family protein [Gammaproteobacteria bacterium]|nr:NAD-dependent epimerase/dehydratase family protein [Gammaproteobacteria bacterium]